MLTLDVGIPEKRLYGIDLEPAKIEAWEAISDSITEAEYAPPGLHAISCFLEKPWVKIALTLSLIAIACWFFPGALTFVSSFLLQPLRWVTLSIQKIFSMIPGVDLFTTTGPPLLQLTAGAFLLIAGIFTSPNFSKGAAANTLSIISPPLVLERFIIIITGFLLNPKLYGTEELGTPLVANSYQSMILGMIFAATVTIPFVEEGFFRWFIPLFYETVVTKIGNAIENLTDTDYTKETEWVIKKTNCIFSSVLFGALHFQNDHLFSFTQALYCGWSAVRIMHPVMEAEGLEGSIAEHMMNNTVAVAPLVLSHALS